MSAAQHWITLSAISVLGVGLLASGAIGVANAMPLVDSSTTAEVPPISTVPGEGKSGADSIDLIVPGATIASAPSSSSTIEQAPAPAPQPVVPRPAATADDSPASPVSLVSPASIDD